MSRSGNQGGRNLIEELKETLRIHFEGAQAFGVDFAMSTSDVTFEMPIRTETYGGVVFPQTLKYYQLPVSVQAAAHSVSTAVMCCVSGANALVEAPKLMETPVFTTDNVPVVTSALLPETVETPDSGFTLLPLPWTAGYSPSDLKIERSKLTRKAVAEKFKKPSVYRFPKMETQAVPLSVHKNPLPIQRKPIPPTRFSPQQRKLFRELLAQKARIPVNDVQLVGVYDRVYLALFQSLVQSEDGSLLCTPKSATELKAAKKEAIPVYLIIGKSLKTPGKSFQVIFPMTDMRHVQ